uniref:IQ motif containing G n=1 Tax=Varanus komodoensis TaxID=61221 RepID=A0A8D2KSV8_VARKO
VRVCSLLPREAQVQLKPAKLTPLDAVRLSALLEDCTDQLTILGYIMPVSYEGRKDVSNVSASCRHGRALQETSSDLKRSNHLFNMATKQSAVSADNLKKVQAFQRVLCQGSPKDNLLGRVGPWELPLSLHSSREEMGRKKIKCLQKQLSDVKKEMDFEVQNRNEMIAYLKDQLQEMKAKTDMESRYVKKDTELQVAQVQKRCSAAENDLQNEIEKLRNQTEQEIRVHLDIESFLKQQQMSIEEKLEYWMEKYEKDTEAKQQALNALKSSRAADQAALQELAKQVGRKAGQAIIEDRKEKERARKKVEQDALEAKSLLKAGRGWHTKRPKRALRVVGSCRERREAQPFPPSLLTNCSFPGGDHILPPPGSSSPLKVALHIPGGIHRRGRNRLGNV